MKDLDLFEIKCKNDLKWGYWAQFGLAYNTIKIINRKYNIPFSMKKVRLLTKKNYLKFVKEEKGV
jgi:hypothetical protein